MKANYDMSKAKRGAVLTPERIQRGDAVRTKLAELDLPEKDIADAVAFARQPSSAKPERKK
jgi:hypothetical protein